MKQQFTYSNLNDLKFQLSLFNDIIKDSDTIEICFQQNKTDITLQLVNDVIKEAKNKNYKNITIRYNINSSKGLNNEKCKQLEELNNYIIKETNNELLLSDNYCDFFTFSQVIKANRRLNAAVDKIKNKPYSPFEKLMLIYEFATRFVYKEVDENENKHISRHWITVLNTDKIVCVGFASIIKELCNRIFDENELKIFEQNLSVEDLETKEFTGHANNAVYIKDDKYGINGIFYLDSCWDCARSIDDDSHNYAFCCLPFQDIINIKEVKLHLEKSIAIPYLMTLEDHKQAIGQRKYKQYVTHCLFSAYDNEDKLFYINKFNPNLKIDINIDRQEEYKFIQKTINTIKEKRPDILKIIENIDLPHYLSDEDLKNLKLYDIVCNIVNLRLSNFDDIFPYLEQCLNTIARNQNFIQNLIEIGEAKKATQEEFLHDFLRSAFIADKDYFIEDQKTKQIQYHIEEYIKNTTPLLETTIPLEAFINGFKVIGTERELKNNELKQFVKESLISSIKKTKQAFDVKKCKHCLATTKIEDIEKGVIKLR